MIWLSTLALAAMPVPATPSTSHSASAAPGATVQALATVRIVAGTRVNFDGIAAADQPPLRERLVELGGRLLPARIADFE